MRAALVGGVVAAAVGGGAPPSRAEDVTTRGDEVVAREAPGRSEAGVAVLRGNARVRLLGEREGWSEILLPDGRRAWVPAADLVHAQDAAPSTTASTIAAATPGATPPAVPSVDPGPDLQVSLAAEIARLRTVVDALEAARRDALQPGREPARSSDAVPLVAAGIGLVVGMLVGGAWARHRARRERSIRF